MRRERFTDLLATIVDNRGRTCPVTEFGTPLIATNCIRNEVLYPLFEKVRFVSEATYDTWFRGHPQPGDIIFVCKGTPGRVCLAPNPVGFCIAQDMVAVRADPKKVYPRFLFALLRSPAVQAQIENMHVGSLIPHFKKGDFDKLFLDLPEDSTQRFIGDAYFELSSKIDLNRKMNTTLEAMARALFKSWFVDFDPVRAKAEGRPPSGMDAETAKLFPSQFEESQLGLIPRGWRVGRLDDLLVLQRGFDLPTHVRKPGPFPVVAASGPTHGHSVAQVRGPGVVTGRSGVLGKVFLVLEDFWPLNTALWVKEFRSCGPYFAYLTLQQVDFAAFNAGSAVPTLNRNHVHGLPWVLPSRSVIDVFEEFAARLFYSRQTLNSQSDTLMRLRDELLPRLVSGVVPVKTAERAMEEAIS